MDFSVVFFLNSILLGIGLAMDAFSVSLANGLNNPNIKKIKVFLTSLMFGLFQGLMPMIGWVCVYTIVEKFKIFEHIIPWIALVLLVFIGAKMIYECVKKKEESETEIKKLGFLTILVQAIATSIDALSVGFTISNYNFLNAFVCALIIAFITFLLCVIGNIIGKKFGTKFSSKSEILGGIILIAIGLEIFISGMISLYA
ncbi:MAG: manganese efflux pump [Clostridia bacterium]|nr:manganese efflux pump [Clostridia bacterium]